MRQGNVYYKDYLAGTITETNEGDYVFQYEATYVEAHPSEFITLPCLLGKKLILTINYFPFLKA